MPYLTRFETYTPFQDKEEVIGLGGHATQALGHGTVTLIDKEGYRHTLQNVLYVSDAEKPIIPLIRAIREGWQLYCINIDTMTFSNPNRVANEPSARTSTRSSARTNRAPSLILILVASRAEYEYA